MSTELPAIVAEYLTAVNAFDTDRIVAAFVPDAYLTVIFNQPSPY